MSKALRIILTLSKASIQREWAPKKPVQTVVVNTGATASDPRSLPQPYNCQPHSEGRLCLFLPSLAGVGEFLLAQVNYLSGCPHHGLDLFAHILIPLTLQMDLKQYSTSYGTKNL